MVVYSTLQGRYAHDVSTDISQSVRRFSQTPVRAWDERVRDSRDVVCLGGASVQPTTADTQTMCHLYDLDAAKRC